MFAHLSAYHQKYSRLSLLRQLLINPTRLANATSAKIVMSEKQKEPPGKAAPFADEMV